MQAIAGLRNAAECLQNGLDAKSERLQELSSCQMHVGRVLEVRGARALCGSKNQICKLGPEFSFRPRLIEALRASKQATHSLLSPLTGRRD